MKLPLSIIILKIAILPLLTALGGCAFNERLTVLSPVGPNGRASAGDNAPGHLIVYNASHEVFNRDGDMAYPHDDYKIYNDRRACIRRVRNRSGYEGEIPLRVDLPAGRYTVIAQSETQGAVAAPVIIESSLTTMVNLEQPPRIIIRSSLASK